MLISLFGMGLFGVILIFFKYLVVCDINVVLGLVVFIK